MNKLKELRKKHKMSQQDLADLVGIHRTAYLRMESGERLPKVDLAIKLAQVFNISVEEVFGKES